MPDFVFCIDLSGIASTLTREDPDLGLLRQASCVHLREGWPILRHEGFRRKSTRKISVLSPFVLAYLKRSAMSAMSAYGTSF